MLRTFLFPLVLALAPPPNDPRMKIVVIDTGISINAEYNKALCTTGHMDFTGTGIIDTNGHGTHIYSIISEGIDTKKYCILVLKFYDEKMKTMTEKTSVYAEQAILKIPGVKYVNLSFGGNGHSIREHDAIKALLDEQIHVSVAIGNDSINFNKQHCGYYPACYAFKSAYFHVIANYKNGKPTGSSNYGGPVTNVENGVDVLAAGKYMTGTSQATALFTRRLVLENR